MRSSARLPLFTLVASVGALGTALLSQYVGGLQPCVLCIYQRWPYVVVIVLSAAALTLAGPRLRMTLAGLAGIAFLVGAGIAGFHVGVEQHWWHGTAQCGGNVVTPSSIEALRAHLSQAPVAACDAPAFTLLGISMAGFNLILSLVLGLVTLLGALRLGGRAA